MRTDRMGEAGNFDPPYPHQRPDARGPCWNAQWIFILNCPPDRNGRLRQRDIEILNALRQRVNP